MYQVTYFLADGQIGKPEAEALLTASVHQCRRLAEVAGSPVIRAATLGGSVIGQTDVDLATFTDVLRWLREETRITELSYDIKEITDSDEIVEIFSLRSGAKMGSA